jgi:iron complex outermembrane receptor protein
MEGSDWSANLALFHLERGLTYTTSENMFTQDGEARYQGLELSGKFSVTPQWIITASTMWLDATNQETGDNTLDGQNIQGVARQQTSLYSEYRLAGLPLTLTAGARYIGTRPVDTGNQWDVDAVALFDLGARYETRLAGNALTLRLNLDNLTDKAYWVTRSGTDSLQQGTPRIIKLSAQIDF